MLWNNDEERLEHLHHNLIHSFAKIKDDIATLGKGVHNINQWILYLHEELKSQDKQIENLLSHIKEYHLPQDELEKLLDSRSEIKHVMSKIENLNGKLETVAKQHEPILKMLDTHHERLSSLEGSTQRPAFKERIMEKISKNSKDYILGLISSTIQKYGRISGLQLREIIVEEQGLCSKSSFYRLLLELETSNHIEVIQQGKEKYYLHKTKLSFKT